MSRLERILDAYDQVERELGIWSDSDLCASDERITVRDESWSASTGASGTGPESLIAHLFGRTAWVPDGL